MSRLRPLSYASVARPLLFGVVVLLAAWAHRGQAAELSIETLFQRPQFGTIKISPNGKLLAVIVRLKGRNNLEIVDLEAREHKPVTSFDNADVVQFYWINNNRLLLAAGDAEEASGKAVFRGWYAVDRDASNFLELRRFDSYLGRVAGTDDDIIVTARWEKPSINDVFRLNTHGSYPKLISYDHPDAVVNWLIDRHGLPRLAYSWLKGTHTLWYRESADSKWTKIDESKDFRPHFTPLAFDYDDTTLYVAADRDGDKRAIYKYDVKAGKLGELVAGSAQVDMGPLIFNRSRRALVGVGYQGDKPGYVWLDADIARLQKAVDQALPTTFNAIQVANDNPHRAVVVAYSDVNPGALYVFDMDKLSMGEFAKTRPWLDPKEMAQRKAVRYSARDGLEIPAYLTLPNGLAGKKPPLVVIIHGGPWVRGSVWGFDTDAQFFASRGYAVLEPEFRGSAGHGWKLLSAGFKQWGLGMQDDVTDGVEWLVKQDIVDKDRVCLFGGSYGGYAVLWGLIKTPDFYKCGVAYVAVTDLNLLLDFDWSNLTRANFLDFGAKDVIGDPVTEAERFRSVSPLVNAERLKAPVLLAYGGKDTTVPIKHGKEFRAALDKYGKTYEWVVYDDEGHGFNKDENRFDFYHRVDAFLKKYLQ